MRDIYRRATQILVWLGDSEPDVELALPTLPALAAATRAGEYSSATSMSEADRARLGLGIPAKERKLRLSGYYKLLKRDYFSPVDHPGVCSRTGCARAGGDA